MASSSSSRNMVPLAVDDKKPIIIDDSGFVSEPDMTSVESNIWGEELIIPHKLEEAGFDALQPKTPKGKGVSKTKDATTSTDSTAPAASSKKTLPNTGAKLRKRTLMASKETGEPTKQKKQKALTIQEPSPAGTIDLTAAAPSGEGQRDTEKASVNTSEASMPTSPKKKKVDKEKKKKKKVKANPKPSAETEKDIEIPHSTSPVEDQPTTNVEAPSTEGPAPRQETISSSSQDPGAQGDNEENNTTPVNNKENLAQDVGTNNVEANLDGNDKGPETEENPTNNPDSEKTISARLGESSHSSEGTDVEMEFDNEDDAMPEATEGGSEILPVSSTSKISADIGISEMQFIAMKDSDPAAALKMLLSSKEKVKRDEAKANLSSAVKAKIDKEANEGIKFFSASAAVDEEIQNLVKSNKVLNTEVSSFKNLYEDLKKQFNV
ncbi:hypothetical protein P8452_47496 [Trifolium repens]|nr:hypothetical protein P8452_47496 [Trifolium repens]